MVITANETVTSKGATLTYNEKIYNMTSEFEDKVTVVDQEKSTIRIGAYLSSLDWGPIAQAQVNPLQADGMKCKLNDDDGQVACTLVQQSGTAHAVTITPKPDANVQLKINAKFKATVYNQMPDKVKSEMTSAAAGASNAASSAANRWEEEYGTFSFGGSTDDT